MADSQLMYIVVVVLVSCYVALSRCCQVDNISVQSNFEFSQIMGKWYVISWFADDVSPNSTRLTDYTQNIVQTADNTATIYAQGRNSDVPTQCDSAVSSLSTPDTTAKLLWTSHGVTTPFWILDTDYTQYAFVYGCYNVSSSGTCSGARAWIWSRTKTLPQSVLDRTSTFYQNICVEEGSFETITFSEECGPRTHWRLTNDQTCNVSTFQIQPDFDVNKYVGTWYEIKWLALTSIPANQLFQDYQHHYVVTEDGNVTGYIYGRSPSNIKKCFYYNILIQKTTTSGKFVIKNTDKIDYPYWVLRTDYTQYAVVYGCYDFSSDGSCNKARSWVWSRTPTLPSHLEYSINSFLQTICVNPSSYLVTDQKNTCPLKPIWTENRNCNVTLIETEPDFDIEKLTRVWYETHWLPEAYLTARDNVTDKQIEVFTDQQGGLKIFTKYRVRTGCRYDVVDYQKTSIPGRFVSTSSTGASFPLWVADTDNDNYVVMYGCNRVGPDGGCLSVRASVWSRTPTLDPHHLNRVNSVLQRLCVNPSALAPTAHSNACFPETKQECPNNPVSGSNKFFTNFPLPLFFIVIINVMK